ncbi:MAG TPA: phosphatase PAP2 family protein [Jiangellaceae bacterium]|nr:phosphatase PAP2 family protein [Jiangellaceae bacterium]
MRYSPRLGGAALGLLLFVVGSTATWLSWRYFVDTATGQRLDNTALRGSVIGRNRLLEWVEPVLEIVSVPFVVAVLGTAAVIALVRRRWLLAVQVIVLVGGANLTTQVLKYAIWDRPDLTTVVGSAENSLPSGHTTVAASAAAALLLVVPTAARPAVTVLGAGYAALTGVSTMIGGWHRPSDVVASMAVVLAWAGLATVATALGPPEPGLSREDSTTPTAVVAGVLAAGSVLAGGLALSALLRILDALGTESWLTGRQNLATAYFGGASGVVAATGLTFAAILVAHQIASRTIPTDRTADARPSVDHRP